MSQISCYSVGLLYIRPGRGVARNGLKREFCGCESTADTLPDRHIVRKWVKITKKFGSIRVLSPISHPWLYALKSGTYCKRDVKLSHDSIPEIFTTTVLSKNVPRSFVPSIYRSLCNYEYKISIIDCKMQSRNI